MSESFISYHNGTEEETDLPRDSFVQFCDGVSNVTVSMDEYGDIHIHTSARIALEPVDGREHILHTITASQSSIVSRVEPATDDIKSSYPKDAPIWELRRRMVPGDVDPELGIKGIDWVID